MVLHFFHFVRSVTARVSPIALLLVRVGLGSVFLSSSLPKLRQPYDFLASVYNYQLVGPHVGLAIAVVLPWLELILGICMVGGILTSGALLVSAGMGAMFTVAVGSALCRGLEISCGCFNTSGDKLVSYMTLVRAIAILLVSGGAYAAVILKPPARKDAPSA